MRFRLNRRDFLEGSLALAGRTKVFGAMKTLSFDKTALAGNPPQNLLSNTFTEAFLIGHLMMPDRWHPYPRWNERAAWETVPKDVRAKVIAQAVNDQKAGWSALLATSFLEFKRNGNRSRYEAQSFG